MLNATTTNFNCIINTKLWSLEQMSEMQASRNPPGPVDQMGRRDSRLIERVSVTVGRKQIGRLSPRSISLLFLTFIISNHPSISLLISGRGSLGGGEFERNEIWPNFGIVSASPMPEPALTSARSASSSSHRAPPMNGSIFGKRSVGNSMIQRDHVAKVYHESLVAESKQRQQHQLGTPPTHANSKSMKRPTDYQDIITEIIEDFLASNNESEYQIIDTKTAPPNQTNLQCRDLAPFRSLAEQLTLIKLEITRFVCCSSKRYELTALLISITGSIP